MPNVTIVKNGDSVVVNFGDYYATSSQVDSKESSYLRQNIDSIHNQVSHITVKMRSTQEWRVGIIQGPDNFVIDSVNAVAPTDIDDLFIKLSSLQQ